MHVEDRAQDNKHGGIQSRLHDDDATDDSADDGSGRNVVGCRSHRQGRGDWGAAYCIVLLPQQYSIL